MKNYLHYKQALKVCDKLISEAKKRFPNDPWTSQITFWDDTDFQVEVWSFTFDIPQLELRESEQYTKIKRSFYYKFSQNEVKEFFEKNIVVKKV